MKNPLKIKEREIVRMCLDYCAYNKIFAKRINVGGMINHKTNEYYYNPYTPRGISDILIVIDGLAYFIECKTRNGKQSENQKLFEAEARQAKAKYFIVRSLDDLIKYLTK